MFFRYFGLQRQNVVATQDRFGIIMVTKRCRFVFSNACEMHRSAVQVPWLLQCQLMLSTLFTPLRSYLYSIDTFIVSRNTRIHRRRCMLAFRLFGV
jgi:hypothetical protein